MTASLPGYRALPGMALISFVFVSWIHFYRLDSLNLTSKEGRVRHQPNILTTTLHGNIPLPIEPVFPFQNIFWAHVGKAGGNTIRVLLRAYCESDKTVIADQCTVAPDSMISYLIKGFIHSKDVYPATYSIKEADAYLYNLRHPVDRMLSWYHYEHPDSCMNNQETILACKSAKESTKYPGGVTARFYRECFPTQDRLSLPFRQSDKSLMSDNCTDLARKAIDGRLIDERGFKHISYNMRYYYNKTIKEFPSKAVLVVRTENLWDDLKDLDLKLDGYGSFGGLEGSKDSHGSEQYRNTNNTLSSQDFTQLCCALQDEMHIYRRLLERSVNLDEASKNATITGAARRCGFSSWNEMVDACNPNSESFGVHQIVHSNPGTSLLPASPPLAYNNILFVHVGKAAGNTLRVLLRVYCESDRNSIDAGCNESPDSVLSDQTKGFFHSHFMLPHDEPHKRAEAFLFNLRDPVDRVMSWYHYEHPKSCLHNTATRIACHTGIEIDEHPRSDTALFYQTCFPNQHAFATAFHKTGTSVLQRMCNELARKVVQGKAVKYQERTGYNKPLQGFKHISYNMGYYVNRTLGVVPNADVLVVRTESLWDDMKDLEIKLGGYGIFGQREGYRDSHGSEIYTEKKDVLSSEEYGVLCCALQEELDVYRQLLQRAKNLEDSEKEYTIRSTAKRCGFPSWDDMVRQCTIQQHMIAESQTGVITMIEEQSSRMQSFDDGIVFVHVGKADGDTVNVVLRDFCKNNTSYFPGECPHAPKSTLSKQIQGYIYLEDSLPTKDAVRSTDAFLYNLGHPVDELLTWYYYEHPDTCIEGHANRTACATAAEIQQYPNSAAALFFQTCFPTLDTLSLAFKRDDHGDTLHRECTDIATDVLGGDITGIGFTHRSNNIRSYAKRTIDKYPEKSVLVVRTESLVSDLKDVDYQLGGIGSFGDYDQSVRRHAHGEWEDVLSTADYGLLCCAMTKEMETYRRLIAMAVNLDETSKETTILDAAQRCGFNSWDEMDSQCSP